MKKIVAAVFATAMLTSALPAFASEVNSKVENVTIQKETVVPVETDYFRSGTQTLKSNFYTRDKYHFYLNVYGGKVDLYVDNIKVDTLVDGYHDFGYYAGAGHHNITVRNPYGVSARVAGTIYYNPPK
ncbi:hypothetical protein ABHN05_11365 [Brevibacillus laterosporus]|uniref:hypothetical protein n=1 Tax=Brevibacillus laterosporus TaxID=1465 RepID=UPI00112A1FCB|nr:hypothetical protein [Brevibacillus laterosporus]MBG9790536.1 hypothetical protein [Brevibacillus laterosporus]MBG9804936.1 hypothetical protein [Brevibacillus laterosporus]MED1786627.1 hypothetical protein [Brevibacillus laterosporus]MED4766135.1 hypothetical protein [Brevibacillus laterosporus]TPH15924.1 hypothetical protein EGH09_11255 [Brevibacillus laterosporus]